MQLVEITLPTGAPYYAPSSFFNRPVDLGGTDSLAADQSQAQHVANQIQYGRAGRTPFGYGAVGYGNDQWPYSIGFNANSYSIPIYAVDNTTPTQKVGLYSHTGSKYYAADWDGLQALCDAVPIPDKSLCPRITGVAPFTDIWAGGTDQEIFIWLRDAPEGDDEGHEFWVFSNSNAVGTSVTGCEWTAQYGGQTPSVAEFSGVYPNQWGAKATSLGAAGGMITCQDIRNVHAGGSIDHALCFALSMNGGNGSQVPPATRGDGPGPSGNTVATIPSNFPGAGGPNPAYHQDVSHEGGRFILPPTTSMPTAMGAAIADAIAEHGLILADTTGAGAFYVEDPRTLGSPYHLQGPDAVDPWSLTWPAGNPFLVPGDPAGWTVLNHLPWDELQVLEPVIG